MKKILLFVFLLLLGFVWMASAEDLGALAKKEKARREALAKEGKKSKTLTNADIGNIKSQLAFQPSASETEGTATEQAPAETAPPEGGTAAETEAGTAPTEESAEAPSTDEQIKELKSQKEEHEKKIDESRETIGRGGLFHTRNVGSQYQQIRESEKKVKETNKKVEDLEKQKEKEEAGQEEEQPQ